VRGRTPSNEIDLEGFFRRGAPQATRIRPFVAKSDLVLEYGGGVGRIATHLSGDCRRLVSVDVNPLMSLYGTALCSGVDFRLLDEIPPEETFDFCYSIAVFFHLAEEEHLSALEYIYRRLKPGAHAVIDLVLGPTSIPSSAETGYVRTTAADAFLSSCEQYFDTKVINLFNQAVILTKRDTRSSAIRPL
jgi:SAM-dependent methyltransferase